MGETSNVCIFSLMVLFSLWESHLGFLGWGVHHAVYGCELLEVIAASLKLYIKLLHTWHLGYDIKMEARGPQEIHKCHSVTSTAASSVFKIWRLLHQYSVLLVYLQSAPAHSDQDQTQWVDSKWAWCARECCYPNRSIMPLTRVGSHKLQSPW